MQSVFCKKIVCKRGEQKKLRFLRKNRVICKFAFYAVHYPQLFSAKNEWSHKLAFLQLTVRKSRKFEMVFRLCGIEWCKNYEL